MTILNNYGWNAFHEQNAKSADQNDLPVGRVTSIKGFKYLLVSEGGEIETELSGRLLFATAVEELPKVGDWVFYMDYGAMGYIISVLPRTNELSRKAPGVKFEKQVLAANVDYAFIVQGLDADFNIMRLERYIVQILSCAITPVVLLNKSDLVMDPAEYIAQVNRLKRDCGVYCCSTYSGFGIDVLANDVMEQGKTYILVGSSGTGKSSLLNSLMQFQLQKISEKSFSTGKGKHTTTSRELFQLNNGSLIIDTPGMREFGMTSDEGQHSSELFPEIAKVAESCRYADCKHINEAGCGVLEALNSGALDAYVYESYLKLIKEQRRFEIKIEDKKRLGKQS
ncbi:MAG TPA: ribosome small subunit-dependent GTPase A, partial [Chryseolinea sp.]|nr:ribosome small subunit-dependent GTPase A [Chryseolinea sp.]